MTNHLHLLNIKNISINCRKINKIFIYVFVRFLHVIISMDIKIDRDRFLTLKDKNYF